MIIVNVRMSVDSNKKDAYLKFVNELVEKSLKDEGNVSYEHYKQLGTENGYAIVEHWANQDAFDKHNDTPHFKKFAAEINDYLTEKPEILIMKNPESL